MFCNPTVGFSHGIMTHGGPAQVLQHLMSKRHLEADVLLNMYADEKKKKADLDQELHKVRDELENIETRFPEEVRDLKAQIDFAKQQTTEYEKKTKDLQNELKDLRTKK